ncbi:hypothetical protein AB6A40_004337 [Gnathostoma spinigerum]|uniref:Uncharacterized protein n=1 Tax=Gnathostoma spinigerum TaxID=75299 RepID=A0ABD6ECC4_9BILA
MLVFDFNDCDGFIDAYNNESSLNVEMKLRDFPWTMTVICGWSAVKGGCLRRPGLPLSFPERICAIDISSRLTTVES